MKTYYEISDNASKTIDISKVFFSVMVVFIHVYGTTFGTTNGAIALINPAWLETAKRLISGTISGCAVPAFFFYSALLLYRKEFRWKDNVRKKIRTLMVPYLILNVFWMVFDCFVHVVPFFSRFLGGGNIFAAWGWREWVDSLTGIFTDYPYLYPLWFVRDLFLLNLLASVIRKGIDRFPKISVTLVCAVYLLVDTKLLPGFASNGVYNHEVTALCFWCFGYFFVKFGVNPDRIESIKLYQILIPYAVFAALSVLFYDADYLFILSRICALTGIVFWYKLSSLLNKTKWRRQLLFLSSFSFSIYIFHERCLSHFRKICAVLLPNTLWTSLFMYFVVPFIIVAGCIILSVLMNRVTPKTYALLTGNRTKKQHG